MMAAPLLLAANEPGGTIEVAVGGVRSADGRVRVEICPRALLLHDCPWSGEAPARPGTVIVRVRGVPPGSYAAQGFHDADGNGRLDSGLFGIPREGAGFSRIVRRLFGRPRFDQAAFTHGTADQRVALPLIYYR